MKPIKLDRSEPFDVVHGADDLGRAYCQNQRYFSVEGDEITETDTAVDTTTSAPPEDIAQALVDAEAKSTELEGALAEKNAELERAKLDLAAANEQIAALKEASPPKLGKPGKKA